MPRSKNLVVTSSEGGDIGFLVRAQDRRPDNIEARDDRADLAFAVQRTWDARAQ